MDMKLENCFRRLGSIYKPVWVFRVSTKRFGWKPRLGYCVAFLSKDT